MARHNARDGVAGWQAAFSSQPRKDPGGGCLGERQMALWSRHFVGDTAWGGADTVVFTIAFLLSSGKH